MNKQYRFFLSLILIAGIAAMLFSCQDKTGASQSQPGMDTTGMSSTGTMRFEGQIFSIPSPVLVSRIIRKNNLTLKSELLNSVQNRGRYLNETKKALNLGVYGADLAYLANFDNGQMGQDYFDVLAAMSADLGILEHVDRSIVVALSNNLSDRDSILSLNAALFQAADRYLKNNERPAVSSFILIGGWIESLHIAGNVAAGNSELRSHIGEQKYSAPSIRNLVNALADPSFEPMKSEIVTLCDLLEDLESTYTYQKPICDKREKTTYLLSNSVVSIGEEELGEIMTQIAKIRTLITE